MKVRFLNSHLGWPRFDKPRMTEAKTTCEPGIIVTRKPNLMPPLPPRGRTSLSQCQYEPQKTGPEKSVRIRLYIDRSESYFKPVTWV
jgi:hypothetical protein